MKKSYKVVHIKNARDPFSLNEEQIQHEYKYFSSMLAMLFDNPSIEANCESIVNSIILTLDGAVSEDELDLAAEKILLAVNNKKVDGRYGQPNFGFCRIKFSKDEFTQGLRLHTDAGRNSPASA